MMSIISGALIFQKQILLNSVAHFVKFQEIHNFTDAMSTKIILRMKANQGQQSCLL